MKEAPVLKTKRLLLRAIKSDDAGNLKYLLHPEILKDASPYMPRSQDDLPVHLKKIIGDTSWIIENEKTVIGDISVHSKKRDEIGEIAYYIDPKYWRMGYATEACLVVIDYMLNTLNFTTLTALVDYKNIPSCKLLEKLGFKLDCIKKDSDLYGKKADVCCYSICRTN